MRWLGGGRITTVGGALAAAVLIVACSAEPPSNGLLASIAPTPSTQVAQATKSHTVAFWTKLTAGEPFYGGAFEGPFDEITGGVAYGDGFVLVGRGIDAADVWHGVIWTSPDGAAWTRAVDGGAGFDGMYIPRLATDGRRLVALGWAVPWDKTHGPYVAWVSDDGVTWQRHEEVASTDLGGIDAEGIVGSPSGFFAWGSTDDGHTLLVRSIDGLGWQEVAYADADKADIRSIAPLGSRLIAVGAAHDNQPGHAGGPSQAAHAWLSPDGHQWLSVPVSGGWSLSGVYPAAAGVFAIGAPECSSCISPRLMWHSVDGNSWSSRGPESGTYPFVASNGSQVAVFDWQGDRSVAISDDGITFHKAITNVPSAEYDAGVIVGSTGVLLLVAKTPVIDGVQVVHSGVLFLRGT